MYRQLMEILSGTGSTTMLSKDSKHLQALLCCPRQIIKSPQGLKLEGLQQLSKRTFSGSARRQVESKIKDKQKFFQEDNGVPVHLKGGAFDAILYRITMTGSVIGTCYLLYTLYHAAMPKKA